MNLTVFATGVAIVGGAVAMLVSGESLLSSYRDRRLVLFCQDVLASDAGDRAEKAYWSDVRRAALMRLEARQAQPWYRFMVPLVFLAWTIVLIGATGHLWRRALDAPLANLRQVLLGDEGLLILYLTTTPLCGFGWFLLTGVWTSRRQIRGTLTADLPPLPRRTAALTIATVVGATGIAMTIESIQHGRWVDPSTTDVTLARVGILLMAICMATLFFLGSSRQGRRPERFLSEWGRVRADQDLISQEHSTKTPSTSAAVAARSQLKRIRRGRGAG